MDTGVEVAWEHRVRDGELSAIQTAENLLIETGEQFWAEYQNEPRKAGVTVYELSADAIMAHATDRKAGVVPADVVQVVAGVDVNPSYGLTWGVVGFTRLMAHVIDYGRHNLSVPKDMPEIESARIIHEGLVATFRLIAARGYQLNMIAFDVRGWNYEAAYNLSAVATRLAGVSTVGVMGFGARQYRPNYKGGGRRGNNWHVVIDPKRRQYIACNADFWKEIAQKAWCAPADAPGSCTLPVGNHREFAEQICREPLLSKTETPLGVRWEYASLPGPHDMGDVMQMCYLGADVCGIGTGGARSMPPRRYMETRKAKYVGDE
jgi:hypothetical protein